MSEFSDLKEIVIRSTPQGFEVTELPEVGSRSAFSFQLMAAAPQGALEFDGRDITLQTEPSARWHVIYYSTIIRAFIAQRVA